MRLLELADACRDAGLNVVETNGWRTRGADFVVKPSVVVAHHTASSKTAGSMPSLNVLIDGRPDLPGPLCQVGLSRGGVVYVIAAGKANHAGPGRWAGFTRSDQTIGCEAENDGVGEPWTRAQTDAYDLVAAVLLDLLGSSASLLCAHREWATPAGRKIDPAGIDMDAMRRRVGRLLEAGMAVTRAGLSDEDVERIAKAVWDHDVREREQGEKEPTVTKARNLLSKVWERTNPKG